MGLGSEEQLEIQKAGCSNPVLEGASVRYELKKPFVVVAEMASKEIGVRQATFVEPIAELKHGLIVQSRGFGGQIWNHPSFYASLGLSLFFLCTFRIRRPLVINGWSGCVIISHDPFLASID